MDKIKEYISKFQLIVDEDVADVLIASHKRQREIVSEYTKERILSRRRCWFLPRRLWTWFRGET